jgi:CrcB protein
VARTALAVRFPAEPGAFPWGTFVVNLSGAFLLALLLTLLVERLPSNDWARPLLGTGLVGAYTTFSTLALELDRLVAARRPAVATAYLLVSLAGGMVAAVTGVGLARGWPWASRTGRLARGR